MQLRVVGDARYEGDEAFTLAIGPDGGGAGDAPLTTVVATLADVGPAGGARPGRTAPDRPAPEHPPIPVPHPETWELLPTPDR